MSDLEVKRTIYETRIWANAHGFSQDAEDMAQYALLHLIQNRQTTIGCLCIDYLRAQYGNRKTKHNEIRLSEKTGYIEIDEDTCSMQISNMDKVNGDIDFSSYKQHLGPREQAIVTLRYKWGFAESEIGDCFGVSEGRISQELKEIKAKLLEFVTKETRSV